MTQTMLDGSGIQIDGNLNPIMPAATSPAKAPAAPKAKKPAKAAKAPAEAPQPPASADIPLVLMDALVEALMPTLDEALAAYEASGSNEDFMVWNEKYVSDYADARLASRTGKHQELPQLPANPPKEPAKATKPLSKSGKVETSLTTAEKAKRQKALETLTADIRKETSSIANSYMRIGYRLWKVKEDKLYMAVEVDGKPLKNVYAYSDIAYAMFGYSQLSLMLPLDEEKINHVTPEMTANQIRALKNDQPSDQDSESSDTPTPTEKPARTVQYDGMITAQTYDRIMEKLDKLMGMHIQILLVPDAQSASSPDAD